MPPSPPAQNVPLRHRLRRWVHRRRRLIACLLFSAASGVAVQAAVGDDHPTVSVVGAAHDLPVGTVLTAADLRLVQLPVEAVVGPSYDDPQELVGQQLAAPLLQGTPLPTTALVGEGLLTGMAEGTAAVPLRPADPSTVQLLRPGQLVDVVLRTGNGYDVAASSTVLARAVPVLWTAGTPSAGGIWPGTADGGGLVVVAADEQEAASLAGSSSSGDVHLILTSGP